MSESLPERFRRLEPLIDRALELEGEARESFLRACADIHPDLIAELRRALDEDDSALPTLGKVAAEVTRSPATDRRGLRAGPWRLTEKIGRGGMGTVYVAQRDDGAFDKRVAVKLLRHNDGRFKEQLERERQLLAKLDHPGIARLLDGGLMRDGQPYLVMELAEGENLDVWCEKQQPDLRRRIGVFLQVCAAVAYAHSHLVVHRDLKPSNIRVDAHDRVKLLDFGIAKLLDAPSRGDTRSVAVTPEFAAPEQLDGAGITTRTDVYALGALLYQMLTGRSPHPPFEGNWAAHIEAVCRIGPVPPSQGLRDRPGPLPAARLRGDLDAIVMRALARDPAQRYATPDALAEDLLRHLDGRPVRARPSGLGYRLARWYRRNWLAASLGSAAALALVIGSLGLLWQSQRVAAERDLARLEARRSDAVLNYLLMTFRAAGEEAGDGANLRAKAVLDQGVARIEQDFAKDPSARQLLLATLGELYIYLNDYTGAEPLLQSFALLEDGSSPAALRAQVQGDLALLALHRGEADQACAHVQEGFVLIQGEGGDLRSLRSDLLGLQGQCLRLQGKVAESIAAYVDSLALRRAVDGGLDRRTATAENNLALAYLHAGRTAPAREHLREALRIFEASGYGQSSHAANALNNLAALAFSAGELGEAQQHFARALAVRRASSGESAALGALLSNHGRALTLLGRFDEAEAAFVEALRLQASFTGEDSLDTASVRLAWADLLLARGRGREAQAEAGKVIAVFEQRLGANHALSARARIALARAHQAQGRLAEAEAGLDAAIATLREAGAAGVPFLGASLCQRAELALARNQAARAEAFAGECLDLLRARVAESHWDVHTGLGLQAAARHRQSPTAESATQHAQAVAALAESLGSDNPRVLGAQAWLERGR
jgi:eukaryotic-like serine/threonine-protein kinase